MRLPEIKPLFDAATIQHEVEALGGRLDAELGDSDPLILSLLGSSVIFVADLVRALSRPVRFEFVQIQYGRGGEDAEFKEMTYPIPVDVSDQELLVIKDVVASGVIETYLASQLRHHRARRVRFATLVDLPQQRKTDFEPDYRVFSVEGPGILVGYGLKHEGRYGNLPYLGRLPAALKGNPGRA